MSLLTHARVQFMQLIMDYCYRALKSVVILLIYDLAQRLNEFIYI